jgi:hypothetical protein
MLKTSHTIESFCSYPFTRLKFTPEGDVTMCCFQTRKCLGNILEKSLEQIWFSDLAKKIRSETEKGRLHRLCANNVCPFFYDTDKKNFEFNACSYPIEFEIDLPTQHCNIGGENPSAKNPACIMCERNMPSFKHQKDYLNEICKKLKPYTRYLKALHIQGIAESFWKDRIFEIINILGVETYKRKIRISTTTNGTLMSEKRSKRFLDFPLSTIVWSLDASTPETYKKIRQVDMYNKIIENLKFYAKERDPCNQFLHIHNTINTINLDEVVGMVEIAAEVGVNCLEFNATYGGLDICVNKNNFLLFKDAQNKIIEISQKLGVYTIFMRDLYLDFDSNIENNLIQLQVTKKDDNQSLQII